MWIEHRVQSSVKDYFFKERKGSGNDVASVQLLILFYALGNILS